MALATVKPTGVRIQRTQPCGVCMANQHEGCVKEFVSLANGNTLVCGCPKCFPGKADAQLAIEKAGRKKTVESLLDSEDEEE